MAPNHKRAISVIDLDGSPTPPPSSAIKLEVDADVKLGPPLRGKEWLLAKVDELEQAMRVSLYHMTFAHYLLYTAIPVPVLESPPLDPS